VADKLEFANGHIPIGFIHATTSWDSLGSPRVCIGRAVAWISDWSSNMRSAGSFPSRPQLILYQNGLIARQGRPRGSTPVHVLLLNNAGRFRHGGQIICGRWTETAMTPDKVRRLDALASQLAEAVMTAAVCAQEIQAVVRTESNSDAHANPGHCNSESAPCLTHHMQRPLLDESTLSVIWKGKTLHLGHTLAFRLLSRLARRPNQYVTHSQLLQDVWDDDDLATATIRSLVRELRRKLRGGGMTDLAAAIRGHNGRYILNL
jgi:hypothetical protein